MVKRGGGIVTSNDRSKEDDGGGNEDGTAGGGWTNEFENGPSDLNATQRARRRPGFATRRLPARL